MILRRISDAFRKQDWFTVAVETLIVVLGVFLGLQVNNWNAAHARHVQEQVYLERLADDFDLIIERLEIGIDTYSASVAALALLHNAILISRGEVDGELPTSEAMADAASLIGTGSIPSGSSATFQEMIAAGYLSDLENPELRSALYDYDQAAIMGNAAWQTLRDESMNYVSDVSRMYKFRIDPSTLDGALLVGIDETMLFNDPGIELGLAMIANAEANNLLLRRSQLEKARAVMTLLNPLGTTESAR